MPDSPGRADRMSAVGSSWEALIPKAASSCGVATYTGPDHERPGAACWRLALGFSSAMAWWLPSAAAMLFAVAVWTAMLGAPEPGWSPGPKPGPWPAV